MRNDVGRIVRNAYELCREARAVREQARRAVEEMQTVSDKINENLRRIRKEREKHRDSEKRVWQ